MGAFSLFDKNGDKKISEEELASVYRDLGGAPSPAQIKNMIEKEDADGDKMLNEEEFLQFMNRQMAAASNAEQIIEAFRVMSDDVDGTGEVRVTELKNILTTVGQKLTEEEADMLIKDASQDSSGDMVNYKKFVTRMMARP